MYWDHRVYNHNFYGICLQEYSVEEKRLIGKPKIIYKGTDIKYTEGPHLYHIMICTIYLLLKVAQHISIVKQ